MKTNAIVNNGQPLKSMLTIVVIYIEIRTVDS